MKKIQKTIDTCHDCEFAHIYERNGNQVLICSGFDVDEERRTMPFLILMADRVRHYKVDIPKECPLEDYEPKTDCV